MLECSDYSTKLTFMMLLMNLDSSFVKRNQALRNSELLSLFDILI